jgi:membrane protein implicated in regulation of membrane protease activity
MSRPAQVFSGWLLSGLLLLAPGWAAAYIGPGLSPATIVVVPLVGIGFVLLLVLLIYVPVRRARQRRKQAAANAAAADDTKQPKG